CGIGSKEGIVVHFQEIVVEDKLKRVRKKPKLEERKCVEKICKGENRKEEDIFVFETLIGQKKLFRGGF
ncbi:hypothetical protein CEXT_796581, partial [Caerostris extrusa]